MVTFHPVRLGSREGSTTLNKNRHALIIKFPGDCLLVFNLMTQTIYLCQLKKISPSFTQKQYIYDPKV